MTEMAATEAIAAPACPVPLSAFPPNMQKSLDPASPLPVRMMAAKGILVAAPRDFLTAMYVLTFDPDPKVAETARASTAKMQDKVLVGLRDDDLPASVLSFYARTLVGQDNYLEFVALNQATPDEAIATMAATASEKLGEILAGNQLRILRDDRIVRALVANPAVRGSTKEGLLDFCVRSGLVLADLPEYVEARQRILGKDPKAVEELAQAEQHTVEAVLAEFGEALTSEDVRVDEAKRVTFMQKVLKLSVAQKIKLATLGNKEARTLLLRDSNKLVALAAVTSPRITDGEIIALSNSRTLHDDVMRYIVNNREWVRNYQVKVNLVNNPKCPPGLGLKFLQHLHPSDLKNVARNKNIASMLQTQARLALQKKESGGK